MTLPANIDLSLGKSIKGLGELETQIAAREAGLNMSQSLRTRRKRRHIERYG